MRARDASKIDGNGGALPGRQRNPRGQGERLREEILAAADVMLTDAGDAGQLSLRGVARRAGIAATSVYLHFPDVDHLKVALVERGFADLDAARDAASAGAGLADPAAALLARVRAFARWAVDHPARYRLMFGPDLPAALAYGAARSPTQGALLSLARSIERCQQARLSPQGDDPLQIATLTFAAVHGLVMLRMDRPHFPWPPLDALVDETVRRLVGLNDATAAHDRGRADEAGV